MDARLTKSQTNRVVDGVCAGLAEYFGIDVVIVRAFFVLLALSNPGVGVLLYIALIVIMPLPDLAASRDRDTSGKAADQLGERLRAAGDAVSDQLRTARAEVAEVAEVEDSAPGDDRREDSRRWIGIVLLAMGAYLLVQELNIFAWLNADYLLPVAFILLGAWLLVRRTID